MFSYFNGHKKARCNPFRMFSSIKILTVCTVCIIGPVTTSANVQKFHHLFSKVLLHCTDFFYCVNFETQKSQ